MSFPIIAKDKEYFLDSDKIFKYIKKFNAWNIVFDIESEIKATTNCSKFIKENGNVWFISERIVENHLVDVSDLNISVNNSGKPKEDCILFVYNPDVETQEPIMSYIDNENNDVTIIGGKLQIHDPAVEKVKIYFMKINSKGFGFYVNFDEDAIETAKRKGQALFTISSQNSQTITAHPDLNNTCTIDNGEQTLSFRLRKKNFIYIYTDDFKKIHFVINGKESIITFDYELFCMLDYSIPKFITDFNITTTTHLNKPYYLYLKKNTFYLNYCNNRVADVYPVGAILTTTKNENPDAYFNGEWNLRSSRSGVYNWERIR